MGELKQIKIFELKIFDHCIFVSWNTKKFCKALIGTHIKFWIKWTKNEKDMGSETTKRSIAIFQIFFEANHYSLSLFLCFLCCSFISDAQRTFKVLQFAHSMTQKLLNLVKEWGKYCKMFNDKYVFAYQHIYYLPYLNPYLSWAHWKELGWYLMMGVTYLTL